MRDDEHPEIGGLYTSVNRRSWRAPFGCALTVIALDKDEAVCHTTGYAKILLTSGEVLCVNRAFVYLNLEELK